MNKIILLSPSAITKMDSKWQYPGKIELVHLWSKFGELAMCFHIFAGPKEGAKYIFFIPLKFPDELPLHL